MDGADGLGACLPESSLEDLELCMYNCQCAMDGTVLWMESHRKTSSPVVPHDIAECISSLESSEAALLAALCKHSAKLRDQCVASPSCSALCTLAAGYVTAARVLFTRRQLIHTENACTLAQSRDSEAQCVQRATELQREALTLAQVENDAALETFQALSKDCLRDARCMSLSLLCGFSALSKDTLLDYSASAFALVFKLFVAKCHVVEELIVTAASLLSDVLRSVDSRSDDEGKCKEQETDVLGKKETDEEPCKRNLKAETWFTSMLSCVHAKNQPGQSNEFHIALHCNHADDHRRDSNADPLKATEQAVVEVEVKPPVSVVVLFASLLWNTALCLWRGGDVVAAHQWLCACDVSQLLRAAKDCKTDSELVAKATKESSDITGGDNNDDSALHKDAKEVVLENFEKSATTFSEKDADDSFSLLNWQRLLVGTADYCMTEEISNKGRLQRLARYIMSLRDICAIVINCVTPRDILYVVNEMHHAIQEQQEHLPSADTRAEILTVVMHIVELYLSRRAVRHMRHEALMSSVASSSTEIDRTHSAVRHVCDELVRYLTGKRYWGVDEIERDGLLSLWDTPHGNDNGGTDMASRWLQVQVIGMTLAFAENYEQCRAFTVAMREESENATSLFAHDDATDQEDTWIFWPKAIARKVQHFVWGSSELAANTASHAMPVLRDTLLPLNKNQTKTAQYDEEESQSFEQSDAESQTMEQREEQSQTVFSLPSMVGAALPLLAEESHRSARAVAPSLCLLIAAYHTARATSAPAPLPGGPLRDISIGLDCAAAQMAEELCRCGNRAWREAWQCARAQNAARSFTAALFSAPPSLQAPFSAAASPVFSEPPDFLSAAPAPYDPPVSFDFSAFTSSTAESLFATRQLAQSLEAAAASADENARDACLLSRAARRLLHDELPVLSQFLPWRVVYSTRLHGVSYANFLACSAHACGRGGGPMILAIAPREHRRLVIGAVLSHAPVIGSQRFYGDSGTFLFQLFSPPSGAAPQLRAFRATGANAQFINCRRHSLAVGGGTGCGLFVDSALLRASTAACATFGSPPLSQWNAKSGPANTTESVDIAALELWAVGEAEA